MNKLLDAILDIIDAHAGGSLSRGESRDRLESRLVEALDGKFDNYIRAIVQDELDAVWKELEQKFPDKFGTDEEASV